jgi:uncharacterized protein YukE
MGDERAAPGSISYQWGLTEDEWLGRVRSAEGRAEAAEAARDALLTELEALASRWNGEAKQFYSDQAADVLLSVVARYRVGGSE